MSARTFFGWRMVAETRRRDYRVSLARLRAASRATFKPLHDLSETEFKNRYRLTKSCFLFLCRELKRHTSLRSSQRVSLETKVLTALFFYASGSYQRPVGVAKSLSQKVCSSYINEVTNALISDNIMGRHIKFPETPAARQAVCQKYFAKYGIPGVVGSIDCSHFRIFKPALEEEHLFYCRKHYHSLNVQMICDSDCRILNVNPKYGGANHDSFIWQNSEANIYMQQLHQRREIVWLLGDSGYPQRPWLMTPILNVAAGTPEAIYNEKQIKARVTIENTFGRLKNRWRCLCKDRVLHYKPAKCAKIIEACCVLYNIALDFGITDHEDFYNTENVGFREIVHVEPEITGDLLRGRILRDQLVRRIHLQQES